MPKNTAVYRALIISGDDISDDSMAKNLIIKWNGKQPDDLSAVLEPATWQTHIASKHKHGPETVFNKDVSDKYDLIIGLYQINEGIPSDAQSIARLEQVKTIVGLKAASTVNDEAPGVIIDDFEDKHVMNGRSFIYNDKKQFKDKFYNTLHDVMVDILGKNVDHLQPSSPKKGRGQGSTYDPEVDFERLTIQAQFNEEKDQEILSPIISKRLKQTDTVKILDVGCGYGAVTHNRFSGYDNVEVLAIDSSNHAINIAKERYNANNITYQQQDISNVTKAEIGTFDIAFCSYVLHHLSNPEWVINKLWQMLNTPGTIIARSPDDGFNIHYPPDEDLDFLIDATNKIRGSSDRQNGRKLYTQFSRLDPEPDSIDIEFDLHNIANLTSEKRKEWFEFSRRWRLDYLEKIMEQDNPDDVDIKRYNKVKDTLQKLKNKYAQDDDFLDIEGNVVAVAHKK